MSLFQCENCGCCENTALSGQGTKHLVEIFDWSGIEDRKGKMLCSSCAPMWYSDGVKTKYGEWHDEFKRTFLPMGEFKTNRDGNLEHIETGSIDFISFEIETHCKDVGEVKDNSGQVLVIGAGLQPLAMAVHLTMAETVLPYCIGHPTFLGDPQDRLWREDKRKPICHKTEADFNAIEKAKLERERKGKKRLKSFARR